MVDGERRKGKSGKLQELDPHPSGVKIYLLAALQSTKLHNDELCQPLLPESSSSSASTFDVSKIKIRSGFFRATIPASLVNLRTTT
jgi:hypothetical protein